MSIYRKLMQARIELQNTNLQKTGHNKFAGYHYFELGDFLPQVQNIFNNIGLCGVISFGEELATLTITDVSDPTQSITLTSPMKEANLKGCHAIQNLGAVETYTRRYLWVSAMEIVEHDAIDATTGKDKTPANAVIQKLSDSPYEPLDEESMQFLKDLALEVIYDITQSNNAEAHKKTSTLLQSEKAYIWTLLDSKTRSSIKKYSDELKKEKV